MAALPTLFLLVVIAVLFFVFVKLPAIRKRNALLKKTFPANGQLVLENKVIFYRTLSAADQEKFRKRIKLFLSEVRITLPVWSWRLPIP